MRHAIKPEKLRAASWLRACSMTICFFLLAGMPFRAMGAETAASKIPAISVVLPEEADAVHQRIARVFETQLHQRCGARVHLPKPGDVLDLL